MSAPTERIRVLVADDHKLFREGLISLIGQEPFVDIVGQANDGQEAVEMAHALKPDILIWRAGQVAHVIDTKWKRISDRIDDPKQGVAQADVYQMMAYAHLYKAPRLTLLYPHHAGLGDEEGIRARFRVTGQETLLETASFDISTGADLLDRVRGRILTGIEEMSPALP